MSNDRPGRDDPIPRPWWIKHRVELVFASVLSAILALVGSADLAESAGESPPWWAPWLSNMFTNVGVALLLVGPLTLIGAAFNTRINLAEGKADQADANAHEATERASDAERRAEDAETKAADLSKSLDEVRQELRAQREADDSEKTSTFANLQSNLNLPDLCEAMAYSDGLIAPRGIDIPVAALKMGTKTTRRWYLRFKLSDEYLIAELIDPAGTDVDETSIRHDGDLTSFLADIDVMIDQKALVNGSEPEIVSLAAIQRLADFLIDVNERSCSQDWEIFRGIARLDDIEVPGPPDGPTETWYFTGRHVIPIHDPQARFAPDGLLYAAKEEQKRDFLASTTGDRALTAREALHSAEVLDIGGVWKDPVY